MHNWSVKSDARTFAFWTSWALSFPLMIANVLWNSVWCGFLGLLLNGISLYLAGGESPEQPTPEQIFEATISAFVK